VSIDNQWLRFYKR